MIIVSVSLIYLWMQSSYLCVIDLACTEQSLERVVARNNKACKVDEELAADVEEDEEEV